MNVFVPRALSIVLLCAAVLSGCAKSAVTGKALPLSAQDSLAQVSKDLYVKGSLAAAKGDYEEAVETFRKIPGPRIAAVSFSLSKAFVVLAKRDSARFYAEEAVALNPSNRFYRQLLAGIYFDMKRFSEAAGQFALLAEQESSNTRNLFYLAHAYLADEQFEKSLDTFSRILKLDPSNENAQAQALWLELKLKRYGAAIHSLEGIMETDGSNDKLRLTLGELYLQSGKPGKALEIFREIIREDASFAFAWVALFEVYIEQGEQDTFKKEMVRFFAVNEIPVSRKHEIVKLFMHRAEKDESYRRAVETMVNELVASRPGDPRSYVLRGISRRNLKQYEPARKDFRNALELDSGNLPAWEEMASSFMDEERYTDVVDAVVRARDNIGALSLRLDVLDGYALYRTGAYLRSVKVLERIDNEKEKKQPLWLLVQANITRAMAYDKLGRPSMSIGAYRDVLAIDPDNPLALNNLAYLYAERGENLDEAMVYAKQAVEADPDNPVFLDTLGWLYYKTGDYSKALEYIERALENDPDEAEIYEHLAEIYRVSGNPVKAKEYQEKAERLRGNSE